MNPILSIHDASFDVIAFEAKHQQEFEKAQAETKFSQNYRDDLKTTFTDGQWDSLLNCEPETYQWQTPCYRSGYLSRVIQRFNEQFSSY